MLIENLRTDFYNVIQGKRVLLLVSFDVDALCACKILQYLMQSDHVVYSLVPVAGLRDMKTAFMDYAEQVKHVVFINCGAGVNLVDALQPEDDVTFFVLDNHRPVDVFNIYSTDQVRLLMPLGPDDGVPLLDDIYRRDEDDDEDSESASTGDTIPTDDGSDPISKKGRLDDKSIERRIERRRWEERRDKLLFDYMQFSYYGESSAIRAFDLAWKMSKDNNDLLWWACIGLTEQLIRHKIEQPKYVLQAGDVQGHVSRLNHRIIDNDSASVHCMKLSFDKELQLALYRHWSIYESLRHTTYTACKFRLWTQKGKNRLYEFLADLGLPLSQCRQRFASMDMLMRNNAQTWIEERAEKYGLDLIINGSFMAQYGFKHKFCASDFVYSASALLESAVVDKNGTATDNFLRALDCLSRSHFGTLLRGLDLAKEQLTAIFNQVQTFLDLSQVVSAGPFLYAAMSESAPGRNLFSHPTCMASLSQCLLHAHVTMSKNRKSRNLPLVLSVPSGDGKLLVIGIPPLSEDSPRNFFGQAFYQAGEAARIDVDADCFESHIVEIRTEDSSRFFDALISLLS